MCGLAAILDRENRVESRWIRAMCDVIRHRGPDDEGFLTDDGHLLANQGGADTPAACYQHPFPVAMTAPESREGLRAALGHRRLSIIDLSPAGHQPMSTQDGDVWLVFNGEIYNYKELRGALQERGHRFVSDSDTEVILAAWREWGEDCLHRFNGMFAFVLYDRRNDRLFAARDRFGVKPLYIWRSPAGWVVLASEIKQFTVLPGWTATLNRDRAYDFLNWGLTDHTDQTLFSGVVQLQGGHSLSMRINDAAWTVRRWYDLPTSPQPGERRTSAADFAEMFEDAVRLRLRADVPIGTGLSGGLDSSSIVCMAAHLLQQDGSGHQKVFSACAEDPRFDERKFIDVVVKATRVDPYQCFPNLSDLFPKLADIAWHQDEPFGSTSIYAEWSVFDLVQRSGVKVTLDGHGADEILCGYHVFFGARLAELMLGLRLSETLGELSALRRIHGYTPLTSLKFVADAVLPEWLADMLRRQTGKTTRRVAWLDPQITGPHPHDPFRPSGGRGRSVQELSISQLSQTSLPMQLHWCDRDSMAHSIESRAPFLDYRLVELILKAAPADRISDGVTKRLLREGLSELLPPEIAQRRDKMGFVTPERDWVQNQAPDDFKDRVRTAIRQSGGVLNEQAYETAAAIIDGRVPYSPLIWRMISFGAWMERFSVAS